MFVEHHGALYLVSGAALFAGPDGRPARRYLTDAWRYHPRTGWSRLARTPAPIVAAAAISLPGAVYIFGGDDGENARRVHELKDAHPGFRRRVSAWQPERAAWIDAGAYPSGLVTTMAVEWAGRIVIPGGEDRPGHRVAHVVAFPLDAMP